MLAYLSVIIITFFLLISLIFIKRKYNPLALFNFTWLATSIMSLMNFNGMYSASEQVYSIVIIGAITFNLIGYVELINVKPIKFTLEKINYEERFSNRKYKIIIVVQFVILFYLLFKSIILTKELIAGLNFNQIRRYYFSNEYLSSTLEYLILTYVINPTLIATEIILCIEIFKKRTNKPLINLMLLNIALRVFISGGRMILVEIVFLIFIYITIRKNVKLSPKVKKRIFTIILLTTVGAVIISNHRGSSGTFIDVVFEKIIVNFSGSYTYLSVLLDSNKIEIGSMMGKATFGGITDLFISAMRFSGLTTLETAATYIGRVTSEFVYIGTYSYNAMPTMYYYFLVDFGLIGVIIGSGLLSVISFKRYKKFIQNPSDRNLGVYLLISIYIIEGTMKWLPAFPEYIIGGFILSYLYKNTYVVKLNDKRSKKGESNE